MNIWLPETYLTYMQEDHLVKAIAISLKPLYTNQKDVLQTHVSEYNCKKTR